MYKEFIIIITVIIFVVGMDILTNRYTQNSVRILVDELKILREDIADEKQEKLQEQMQTIKEEWKEMYDVLAYYIEHNELEKVATELTRLSAHIDTEDYKECINQIDTTIFILEHIEEKEKFDWRSIF